MKTKYIQKLSEGTEPLYIVPFAVNKETNKALYFEQIIKKLNEHAEMLEALKWFVNAMNDGSLIVFTDDDQHKAVRDDNQDKINKLESLLKELE